MKKRKPVQTYQTPLEKKQFNIAVSFFIYCLAIIPFINLNFLIDPALFSKFTALSFGLILTILLSMYFSIKAKTPVNLLLFRQLIFPIFLLYILISGLSIFNAVNYSEAFFDLAKNIVFLTFFLISTQLLVNHKNLPLLISKTISVFSFVIIIIGLFQTLDVISNGALNDSSTKEITALFMNKNLYSQMLLFTLPFNVLGIILFSKKWKTFCTLNTLFLLVLIVILMTRSVWVALIVSTLMTMVFAYLVNLKSKHSELAINRKIVKPLIASGFAIIVALVIIASTGGFKVSDNLATTKKIESSQARLIMWGKSLEMFTDNTLLGIGGGQWKIQLPNSGIYEILQIKGKTRFQRPHNDYLWILTEYGIFGLLAYLAVLFIGLFYLARIVFLSQNKEDRIFYLLMFFGFMGYITFSFFSYPKERIEHNIYFFFILSLITTKHYQLAAKNQKNIATNKLLSFTLAFFLILSTITFVGFKKISGESHAKLAIEALHAERYETTINEIEENYSWFYEMDPTATPLLWYKGLANFRKGNNKEALNSFLEATEINPYHSHTYNSIGIIYAKEGDLNRAKNYFIKSLELRPYSTETLLNISTIYLQENENTKALEELSKINPKTKDDRYKITIVKALEYEVDRLTDSIQDPIIRQYIPEFKKSKPTTLSIYKKCMKEGHSFKAQYLNYIAENLISKDSTLTRDQINQLNKYLISH